MGYVRVLYIRVRRVSPRACRTETRAHFSGSINYCGRRGLQKRAWGEKKSTHTHVFTLTKEEEKTTKFLPISLVGVNFYEFTSKRLEKKKKKKKFIHF